MAAECNHPPRWQAHFAGTYFPKNQWINILNRVQEVYQRTPEKAEDLATQLTAQLQTMQGVDVAEGKTIEEENWHKMATTLLETMDKKWGREKGSSKISHAKQPSFPVGIPCYDWK